MREINRTKIADWIPECPTFDVSAVRYVKKTALDRGDAP
jgi:hypothetical protein